MSSPTQPQPQRFTNAQLQAMIDQGVTAALAARDATRNGLTSILQNGFRESELEIKESSDEESSSSKSEDEEYAMTIRDFKKFFKRRVDVETQIILSENVRNYRDTRTKKLSSEVLGAIAVMKRLKMKRVSWLMHIARYISNPLTLVMKTLQ
ncbi:hypothetical protein Tco_0657856 [Tanacetum coccineum]